ncbi:hypothetical protein MOP88_14320 [Sphingomonas sp. WKB10]|nr:hypothetical protein [Sphingomonas sp. WKB10]
MAFPTIVSVTPVTGPAQQNVTLYSSIACQPGDLLAAFVYQSSSGNGTIGEPSGTWTFAQRQAGSFNQSVLLTRWATSTTDSLSVSHTWFSPSAWGAVLYVIRGANNCVTTSKAGSFSATAPGLTLPAAYDAAWVGALVAGTTSAAPTGYSNLQTVNPPMAAAQKLVNASSETAYAWNSSPNNWASFQLAAYYADPPPRRLIRYSWAS